MRRIRAKKMWTDSFDSCSTAVEDLQVMYDFFKEGEYSEQEVMAQYKSAADAIENLEFKNMLSAEEDALSAVMQITSGACARSWPIMVFPAEALGRFQAMFQHAIIMRQARSLSYPIAHSHR